MERTFLNGLVQRELGIFFSKFSWKKSQCKLKQKQASKGGKRAQPRRFFNFTSDWLKGWPEFS